MEDKIYGGIAERIKQMQADGAVVIKRETLEEFINLSNLSREDLETRCKRAIACVCLYQNGFRAVVRGTGLYLDYQNCGNPIFLQRLTDNANLDADQKAQVAKAMANITNKAIADAPDYAQFALGVDEHGNMRVYQEITSEEIIQMLEKVAR